MSGADSKGRSRLSRLSDGKGDAGTSVGSVVQLVKDYARQETVGPIRGAGRWLLWGVIGALLMGLASAFLVLGVLRLLQTEFHKSFRGQWTSVIPYLVAVVVAVAVIGLAVSRIGKKSLHEEGS